MVEHNPALEKELRKNLRILYKKLPTKKPVRLKLIYNDPKIREYGSCEETSRSFLIRVQMRQCRLCTLSTLLHEYAHALAWPLEKVMHNSHFWVAYGHIYDLMPDDTPAKIRDGQ